MYEYARAFGYGQKSGIGLLGEVGGILHPVNKWDGLTITRFPIGYAVGATPLQIHNAVSTIANFGILMQPQVINKITDKEGKTVVAFKPNAKRRVISIDAARQMGEMMTGVVTSEGTARRAALDGFMVSGKLEQPESSSMDHTLVISTRILLRFFPNPSPSCSDFSNCG